VFVQIHPSLRDQARHARRVRDFTGLQLLAALDAATAQLNKSARKPYKWNSVKDLVGESREGLPSKSNREKLRLANHLPT
jgi:hypothetical protein